jgi:hypothetical protein
MIKKGINKLKVLPAIQHAWKRRKRPKLVKHGVSDVVRPFP